MEATNSRASLQVQVRRLLATRSGTLMLAAAVAAAAGLILLVFLGQYRDSVRGGAAPATALVAGSLIPKGTAGDAVIDDQLFKPVQLPQDQLRDGAVADASAIAGRSAVRDIYPGQQITAADFARAGDPVRGQLTGTQRAMSVPLDGAHGVLGHIRTGDHVDVLAGFNTTGSTPGGRPIVRMLMQDVLVLSVPDDTDATTKEGNITIRVTDRQAGELAYAADNGKVWFALRPPAGASESSVDPASLAAIAAGNPPVAGGRR